MLRLQEHYWCDAGSRCYNTDGTPPLVLPQLPLEAAVGELTLRQPLSLLTAAVMNNIGNSPLSHGDKYELYEH